MIYKTPKFDQALDAIFKNLVPHERVCLECNKKFKMEAEDINFYKMFRVPPPTRCPKCRQTRRFGLIMRMPKFFKRPCAAPGHNENIVTVFPADSPHKVYDTNYWNSDSWEATSYSRDYDSNRKFFEQFKDLFFDVPHLPLDRDVTAVNSEYTLGGRHGKNNYYCGGPYKSEDCSFGTEVRFSKNCVDCSDTWYSEFCYECAGSDHCNRCVFVVESSQCIDSAFLYDCKNCINCFLSSNLRNKSFVFENKQLSKEEYQKEISRLNLGDRNIFKDLTHRFGSILNGALHRSVMLTNATNCVGDMLTNCNNCFWSFDGTEGDNFRFVETFDVVKDSMDSSYTPESSRLYESILGVSSNNILFSVYIRDSLNMEYSSECLNCHDCFGCVGLKNKKFHILNKSYSENDYWKSVDEIKSKMFNDSEYGELFPLSFGLFPYQVSRGQKFYPLTEKEATQKGIPWYPEKDPQVPDGMTLRDVKDIPSNIKEVDESILNAAVRCEVTGKPFRITAEEFKFYKYMNLPIPTRHPWQRIMERGVFGHPNDLFPFVCQKCGEKSFSIYDEEKQKQLKIFCEKCYLKEIV
ncbi:MAG: hypothetical protein NTY04_03950 [Candidatus Staskawiczbacteria bacterium]|nr:hypothetical protein [Candidatus Staskawiczbacteria bacterium]